MVIFKAKFQKNNHHFSYSPSKTTTSHQTVRLMVSHRDWSYCKKFSLVFRVGNQIWRIGLSTQEPESLKVEKEKGVSGGG